VSSVHIFQTVTQKKKRTTVFVVVVVFIFLYIDDGSSSKKIFFRHTHNAYKSRVYLKEDSTLEYAQMRLLRIISFFPALFSLPRRQCILYIFF